MLCSIRKEDDEDESTNFFANIAKNSAKFAVEKLTQKKGMGLGGKISFNITTVKLTEEADNRGKEESENGNTNDRGIELEQDKEKKEDSSGQHNSNHITPSNDDDNNNNTDHPKQHTNTISTNNNQHNDTNNNHKSDNNNNTSDPDEDIGSPSGMKRQREET